MVRAKKTPLGVRRRGGLLLTALRDIALRAASPAHRPLLIPAPAVRHESPKSDPDAPQAAAITSLYMFLLLHNFRNI